MRMALTLIPPRVIKLDMPKTSSHVASQDVWLKARVVEKLYLDFRALLINSRTNDETM